MTDRRDIERVLDHWLAEGPTHVADRVVLGALETVEHTAQPRFMRWLWRDNPMNQVLRVATAAALVVVIGAGTIVVLGRWAPFGAGSPSAEPSAVALNEPELSAGVLYRVTPFDPAFTITGRQGWFRIVPATPGTAFFGKGPNEPSGPDDFSLTIIRPTLVLPVGAAGGEPLPADLIAWLQSRSDLSLSAPATTQVDGMPARVIEGTLLPTAKLNTDDNVILMCWTGPCGPDAGGALAVTAAYHFEIFVLDVRGQTVVIRADSPVSTWASGRHEVDDFLATIHFPA